MTGKSLETMLNEVADDIKELRQEASESNISTYNKKMDEYKHCIGCDRRLFVGLFSEGSNTCCHCKGLDAYGNKVVNTKSEWSGY